MKISTYIRQSRFQGSFRHSEHIINATDVPGDDSEAASTEQNVSQIAQRPKKVNGASSHNNNARLHTFFHSNVAYPILFVRRTTTTTTMPKESPKKASSSAKHDKPTARGKRTCK